MHCTSTAPHCVGLHHIVLRCTLLPCASAMHSTRRYLFRAILQVWGENPMGLLSQSTSRVLRMDASEVRPAWPLPVRDLHPDAAPINADIDFQSGRSRLRASWLGWYSPYSWILEYRVSLYAVNGTQTFLVCPGVAVGLATNATSVDLPGCAHGVLEHGLTYVWTVTALGCNEVCFQDHL